ncbi:GPW/gp25 family protein [Nonomuraea zeae]|nr:GPW/gp25 family protein [Nonomuraea zeae]
MTMEAWIGRGPRFPWRPGVRGGFEYAGGEELIRQSIEAILDTEPGERIMLPGFGCGLRRYLMEPNSVTTRAAMRRDIEDALSRWEPRIETTNVSVTAGEEASLVWIDIAYRRLADRREDNLVYPFYLR